MAMLMSTDTNPSDRIYPASHSESRAPVGLGSHYRAVGEFLSKIGNFKISTKKKGKKRKKKTNVVQVWKTR